MADSDGLKWIEVFKAGYRTASSGLGRLYPVEELQAAAANYAPELFKAPLIVSYPAHNTAGHSDTELYKSQLAYGFPEALKVVGDRLMAGFKKISPQVKEWIANGQILGFSSSFYLPDSPFNPCPGSLSLRHIAACGTDPPAVKGMETPELAEPLAAFADYAEEQEGAVEFALDADPQLIQDARLGAKLYQAMRAVERSAAADFMGGAPYRGGTSQLASLLGSMMARLRDREIEENGVEEADLVFPRYELDALSSIGMQTDYGAPTWEDFQALQEQIKNLYQMLQPGYSDGQEQNSTQEETEDMGVSEQEFSELQAQNAQLQASVERLQAERVKEQVTAFVEAAIRDNRLHPNNRDREIQFILNLPDEATANYGEDGDLTPRQAYMAKITAAQPLWSDSRLPIGPGDAPNYSDGVEGDIVLPPGYSVDPESASLYRKALAHQSAQNCTFSEAVAAVSNNGRR